MFTPTLHTFAPSSRRRFLAQLAALGVLSHSAAHAQSKRKARIAITLDLEMSRNFPTRDTMHWDYEKGNLNEPTKKYTVEACRRVKARGGVIHAFCVGRVLEQENVDWLKEIHEAGHPIGNHTYDHVNIKARTVEETQFRFQRAPWLVEGKSVDEIVAENIKLANRALKQRLKIDAAGFRTPGGYHNALDDRPDLQKLLLKSGFRWVSSKYPGHPIGGEGKAPTEEVYQAIVAAQKEAQPYVYPSGLIEIPMSPISDIGAFRTGRWKLEWFLEAVRRSVAWAIEEGATFDFLGHPSCLYVVDPEFRTIDLICDMVHKAKERAEIVDLNAIAARLAPN